MSDIYLPANGAKLIVIYHDPYGVDEFNVLAFRLLDGDPKEIDVVTLSGLGFEDAWSGEGEEPAYTSAVLFPDGTVEEFSQDGGNTYVSREAFIGPFKRRATDAKLAKAVEKRKQQMKALA